MIHPNRDIISVIARDIAAGRDPRKSVAQHESGDINTTKLLDALRMYVEKIPSLEHRRDLARKLVEAYPNSFATLDLYCETFKKDLDPATLIKVRMRAAGLEPKSRVATIRLAEAYELDGQNRMALDVVKAAIRSGIVGELLDFRAGYYASLVGDHEEAMGYYRRALKAQVNHRTLLNMAAAARHLGDTEVSQASSQRAILMRPNAWDAYYNLGNLRRELGFAEEAARLGLRAEKLNPGNASIKWNLSHALMASGDFRRGLDVYKFRWSFQGFPTRVRYPGISNVTDIDTLAGRVFVYTEQGVGDNILFSRFIPRLLGRLPEGATATFECYESTLQLFRHSYPEAEFVPYNLELPEGYDYYLPLFDVPALLGAVEVDPPALPYLTPSNRPELPKIDTRQPRVGLIWAGNPKFTHDQQRSASIDDIDPLISDMDASLFCFQKGQDEGLISARYPAVVDLAPHLTDFDATAALMQKMDLVVSTCTSTANLAGALGIKGLVLTGPARDWRWMTERTTDWFPSLTVLQRPRMQSWASFFVDVRQELLESLERI